MFKNGNRLFTTILRGNIFWFANSFMTKNDFFNFF